MPRGLRALHSAVNRPLEKFVFTSRLPLRLGSPTSVKNQAAGLQPLKLEPPPGLERRAPTEAKP